MIRKIRRKDIKVGMYLVKYGEGSIKRPFVSVEKPVLSEQSVAQYLPDDVAWAYIDDSINLDIKSMLRAAREAGSPQPRVPIEEEIVYAEKAYGQALGYAKTFMESVRRGGQMDYREAVPMVDDIIESVFRNEQASATICKLKRFDEYTFTHSINVGVLAVILGRPLNLDRNVLRMLGIAGLFHDVGKAKVPEEILNKPGKLTDREFQIMQGHPGLGHTIMEGQKGLAREVLEAVLQHHERYDGRGYPLGLKGGAIGKFTRIVSVVDVYDALTSKRVYRDAMAPGRALAMMYQWRLSDFYPNSVEHFIKCMGVYPVGSFVRLSTGDHGIVCDDNPAYLLKPKVKIILDAKLRPRPIEVLDLSMTPEPDRPQVQIAACLNPADYSIDISRYFFA